MVNLKKLTGQILMGMVAVIGLYYTFWVVVLPFVDEKHFLQNYFPARRYAVIVPCILMVFGIGILGIWVAVFLIRERVEESIDRQQGSSHDRYKQS